MTCKSKETYRYHMYQSDNQLSKQRLKERIIIYITIKLAKDCKFRLYVQCGMAKNGSGFGIFRCDSGHQTFHAMNKNYI